MENYIGGYCIIRSDRAGVFAGIVKCRDGAEITLTDCRRLWYWSGAASLSQLAEEGVKRAAECKFTMPVQEITILGTIEIIPTSEKAESNIRKVPEWKTRK